MITAVSETLQALKFILNSELDKNESGYMEVLILRSGVTREHIQQKVHYTFVYIII
jgi:hypothetical protein